ncbi:MAG: sigma-70 family RNA polymerase sigma factor [Planctomycetota bacterium]
MAETSGQGLNARPAFPTTCWSRILGRGSGQRDLEQLAHAYWRPVFGFISALGKPREDARDATQDFFAWLLQSDLLAKADPQRGRFRAFLKTALRNFVIGRDRRDGAAKRGGGLAVVPLDGGDALEGFISGDELRTLRPEDVLDRLWRAALVERATEALRQELEEEGREVYFAVFRDYFLAAEDVDYQDVAIRYDLSRASVSNYLQYAKKRYRLLLRAAVEETVADPEALREELHWLFGESG